MATKKKSLPEITVSDLAMVEHAKEALDCRIQIATLTAKMDEAKKSLSDLSEIVRHAQEIEKGEYIGLIRITDPDMTPVQVQFKITGGALALEEGNNLDQLFGSARPGLFEKDVVVTGFIDPDALIAEIRARNQNPWDYLELKVKKNLDRAIADSVYVTKEEAYLPKEGFLSTLNDVKHTFVDKAKEYLEKYLVQVLRPTVDLGKK